MTQRFRACLILLCLLIGSPLFAADPVDDKPIFTEAFGSAKLPDGWKATGDVTVSAEQPFEGKYALQLHRELKDVDHDIHVTGPAFPITPGNWIVSGTTRSQLISPDNSFKGVVQIEFLNADGHMIDRAQVIQRYSSDPWRVFDRQVAVPVNTTHARIEVHLEKVHGTFWVDRLAVHPAPPAAEMRVHRILFKTAQLGNLLLPDDPTDVNVTVETDKPLPADAAAMTYTVTDYWGAEQAKPATVKLTPQGKGDDGRDRYTATLKLGAKLEVGRYYEVHVAIPEPEGRQHVDRTTLAILPEAITHGKNWKDVPFMARNWDNRFPEYFHLTRRLGIPLAGLWGAWPAEPPYQPQAVRYDMARELGLAVMVPTPNHAIERHSQGYEKWTPEVLAAGATAQAKAYGSDRLGTVVCLGNEPPLIEGRAEEATVAYKAVYEAYKKTAPDVVIVGTSIGTAEQYFAAGMGAYCDVYDYHTYGDPGDIRKTFQHYEERFAKYGHRKPIWSTEIGLNSQGVERRAVAGDMIRKLTVHFACGGGHVSWFGLLYPDPKGVITGTAGDAHNVFNCKYMCYSPKMDALSYYNIVNGIDTKKFVEEKLYDDGKITAELFRDKQNQCLLVIWADGSERDAFVSLPGVGDVKQILIDGSISQLDAGGKGLTLRIGEDPIMLCFESADVTLPAALDTPRVEMGVVPPLMVRGTTTIFEFKTSAAPGSLSLVAPPFWTVAKPEPGDSGRSIRFAVTAPKRTRARAGYFHLVGEGVHLSFNVGVSGTLTAQLLPTPATASDKAGVRIVVSNKSAEPQKVTWRLELESEHPMVAGTQQVEQPQTPQAYFGAAAEGELTLAGRTTQNVDVPLVNIDPTTSYLIKGAVIDSEGREIAFDRIVGGFATAKRTDAKITLDGKPDEAAWKTAQIISIDQEKQYQRVGDKTPYGGKDDLSAYVRILWDDDNLYMAFDITDDLLTCTRSDGLLWQQDGLQFLIDPGRATGSQSGKYDYAMGVGTKGPQVYCHLSASPAVSSGVTDEVKYVQHKTGVNGNRTVEVAFPWARLAPFKPEVGGNLGMTIVINEDDQPMRAAYLNWFGDIGLKSVRANGDIILTK